MESNMRLCSVSTCDILIYFFWMRSFSSASDFLIGFAKGFSFNYFFTPGYNYHSQESAYLQA